MIPAVLTINIGSSGTKFALFRADFLDLVERGVITAPGASPVLTLEGCSCPRDQRVVPLPHGTGGEDAIRWLLGFVHKRFAGMVLAAVGHRVVHGGLRYVEPTRLDTGVLADLESLVPLAPEHQPQALAAIRAIAATDPGLPQVACFDTAFHRHLPALARRFALPRALHDEGIVRYGFHGLSYEYIASVLPTVAGTCANGRVIVAHLGHGASLCAMQNLRSAGTTMGFTPLDGLMMGTRSGGIDPGVLLHLLETRGMGVHEVHELLAYRSGLRGVSGISGDVQELEASDDPRAREALELFAQRAAMEIAAQCVLLGGLDALVFTAGIGERSAQMRNRICARLDWLGVDLDPAANAAHHPQIGRTDSPVPVFVIRTNEELVIARAAVGLLGDARRNVARVSTDARVTHPRKPGLPGNATQRGMPA
ncbi:MAG TPA: acetate/propionate family kinase [Rhodanobacteraceae bacterium]|nr:acetate/propionate family kinase [Rhodanobacteraceae bacterium]